MRKMVFQYNQMNTIVQRRHLYMRIKKLNRVKKYLYNHIYRCKFRIRKTNRLRIKIGV